MPKTEKGRKIYANMVKEYGEKKGKQVFYASAKAGKISGVEPPKHHGRARFGR